MTTQEINKRFAELTGICWHRQAEDKEWFECHRCSCRLDIPTIEFYQHCREANPDFCADPRLVLEVMMKRDGWLGLIEPDCIEYSNLGVLSGAFVLAGFMTNTTGLLALKAIEWMELQKQK